MQSQNQVITLSLADLKGIITNRDLPHQVRATTALSLGTYFFGYRALLAEYADLKVDDFERDDVRAGIDRARITRLRRDIIKLVSDIVFDWRADPDIVNTLLMMLHGFGYADQRQTVCAAYTSVQQELLELGFRLLRHGKPELANHGHQLILNLRANTESRYGERTDWLDIALRQMRMQVGNLPPEEALSIGRKHDIPF